MLAAVERSGLVEASHEGAVCVVGPDGGIVGHAGDVHRAFFARSAAKPFQAAVAMRLGAQLPPEWLAVACASHDGEPIHLAIVSAMLEDAGLSEDRLRCPRARPLGSGARRRLASRPDRRIFHNCSGKHAAMLRACRAQGWDVDTYLDPEHPLQVEITEEMARVGALVEGPIGVDGCGAPVFPVTVRSLAEAYRTLAGDDRYEAVRTAMHRYPALVSGYGNADASVAETLYAAAKRGAEGCFGVAAPHLGAAAVKVWDGADRAVAVAVSATLDQIGWIPHGAQPRIEARLRQAVFGGEREVGTVRAVFSLSRD